MNRPEFEPLRKWIPAAITGLFFLSGAAGLIYEVAWTRMFAKVAGGTTHALTAVLVAYMAGLALGSFLAGRWVDTKVRRPILAYGILEGGIGIFAIFSPLLIPALLPVLKLLRPLLGAQSWAFDLFRFFFSALVLVVPTTLMGATFPILVRGLLFRRERFGLFAGLLYAANTLGAMTGALVSGFALIPALGLRAAVWSAAGLNLMILLVVAIIPALREQTAERRVLLEKAGAETEGAGRLLGLVLWGYGLSGLCAMVYQVGWARVLALLLGNSTYALGLILAAYIGGLFLGGALITPLADRLQRPLAWAAGIEAAIGLSALAVMPLFEWATGRMFTWSLVFQDRFGAYQALRFAAAFGLILLPTLFMGALFPLVVKIAGTLKPGVAEPAGQVYAANTVGAILGAFLAGYLLIRALGVENSLRLATGLSVAVGLVWLLVSGAGSFRFLRLPLAGTLAAAAAAGLILVPRWDPLLMNSGPYLYARLFETQLQQGIGIREILSNDELLFYREGVEATVSVVQARDSGERVLRINGKADASTRGDLPTEVLSAHLPLLLHPAPKKVMVLGLASGITAGSALLHPEVERVDCVEISPEVMEASHYFADTSRLDYHDPRLHLILDDARNYLALSDVRYDVIIIEPTNPWVAGLGMLFTREFYQLIADHLEPGGLALIFFPAYDMDADTVRMVLRTYASVFPETALWETIPVADYLVAGSREPFRLDLAGWQKRMAEPAVAADLARVEVEGIGLLANFVMGSQRLTQAAGPGPLHTDDRSQLEFDMPRLLGRPRAPRLLGILREVLSGHEPAPVIVAAGTASEWGTASECCPEARARLEGFDRARSLFYRAFQVSQEAVAGPSGLDRMIQAWQEVLRACGGNWPRQFAARELAGPLAARGNFRLAEGDPAGATADWEESFHLNPFSYQASDQLIGFYFEAGEREPARVWAMNALRYLPGNAYALAVLGQLAQKDGDLVGAERRFREALSASPGTLELRWNLALALIRQGKFAEAEPELRTLVAGDSGQAKYWAGLAYVMKKEGRLEEARHYLEQARKLDPNAPEAPEVEPKIP